MTTKNETLVPVSVITTMLAAMYFSLVGVANDAFQGPVQRIFYIHLAMWLPTFVAFAIVGVASSLYLWKKEARWDHIATASAELGLLFCTLGLATGCIWAKPIWGTWWTWDPRLTLTLILWMIYAAYLLLRSLATDPSQGSVLAAILGVSGILNLYLINRAVYWWRGIHPAVVVTKNGGTGLTDPMMRFTLALALLAFFLLFLWLLRIRVRTAQLEDEIEYLRNDILPSSA